MSTDSKIIKRLGNWYASMCNDDWEHTYGVSIGNIDNPGWFLKVELQDTYLYEEYFAEIIIQREDEDDWVNCKVVEGMFQGFGGPINLEELLCIFLDWAEKNDINEANKEFGGGNS